MSINVGTDDEPLIVFAALSGGLVDFVCRAASREAFEGAARQVGLVYEVTERRVAEDGTVQEVGTGVWLTPPGVEISHIGPVTLAPGVYDANGNQITPPVTDDRHHVNVRLGPPASERLDDQGRIRWHVWARDWTENGWRETPNAKEDARALMDVALIDPATIRSPAETWL